MRPEVELAKQTGSIARINQLWSAIFQLNTLSNNMVEEISDILEMNHLRDGRLKYLHNNFIKSANKFFTEFNTVMKPGIKMDVFKDMDKYAEKFYEILELERYWKPNEITEENE